MMMNAVVSHEYKCAVSVIIIHKISYARATHTQDRLAARAAECLMFEFIERVIAGVRVHV